MTREPWVGATVAPVNAPAETPSRAGGFFPGFFIGLAVGLALLCLVSGAGYVYFSSQGQEERKGWNLVPVIVMNSDLAAGAPLTFDAISQRSIPEQFVTKSNVGPDSASKVVGKQLVVPLRAKDPLRWSDIGEAAP